MEDDRSDEEERHRYVTFDGLETVPLTCGEARSIQAFAWGAAATVAGIELYSFYREAESLAGMYQTFMEHADISSAGLRALVGG